MDRIDKRLLTPIRELHDLIREKVIVSFEGRDHESLSEIDSDLEGDTIYAIDRISESVILEFFEKLSKSDPLVIVAEGLEDGKIVLPEGKDESDARWRIIIDPIDGTRSIMYQKRSAWVLTGVAPNLGPETCLSDIQLAVQTEIPTLKQNLSDTLYAFKGEGLNVERFDHVRKSSRSISLRPSKATDISHGYAYISRFFPGVREELAAIDEEIVRGALGPVKEGKTHCFEDQYASTGGQLYELISGHDRFIADIRPLMKSVFRERGLEKGICCHPYDICTELLARECGVIITNAEGGPLRFPLDVRPDVDWVGFANQNIRKLMEPLLSEALTKRGLKRS